ncbi:ABC transporter permease [Pedobacter insulae]|uniref:Putative ABC transport system permease protein n=1 Tax=Pedobacter insulae TaxID=414048 RepID=A0A1I2UHL6_9SPHI|nr:FtsX-like permease family protein [Pedobacter insulae]SFG75859.1 putative ABC transport system permease protein [Pedobacter insulae]
MSPLKISWKSLWSKPLSASLNIMLIAFGTGILTILLLASTQIEEKLNNNSKDIDLVVGAKGSPLQLILSSIYYIDFPTGNIPLKEANELSRSPFVKRATPLALGDNYNGVRIVGTDSNFVSLYGLKVDQGKLWVEDLEATIGVNVAKEQKLKVGDTFNGSHGLTNNSDVHKAHTYKVVGILSPQGNVTDNLILTNVASVWKMHEEPHEHQEGEVHDHEKEEEMAIKNREITSLLIQYRSPMSVAMFPRMVNQMTSLQSASPAMESTRLFSLIGVGVDTLQWFAILIMLIAAISVFVNLYNSLKERSYDLAIMRTLGASRTKLFIIVILEGLWLTLAGTIIGLFLGHSILELIGYYQESTQAKLTGKIFVTGELYLLIAGLVVGIIASLIPAMQAYRSNISKILAKN